MGNGSVAAFYEDYSLYWYGITIGIAILLGVVTAMFMRLFQRERVNDVLFTAIPSIPLGLMGARAFYSWHNDNTSLNIDTLTDPGTYLDGGFALYGALAAGLFVMMVVCIIFRINLLKLADACAPGLALGIGIGRLASQFSATDRGAAVSADWLKKIPFSTWDAGSEEWLLNVYFFEAIASFLIFAFLVFLFLGRYHYHRFSCYRGDIALAFMMLYGLSQCFFEAIRTDSLYWYSTIVSRLHFVLISQAISAVIAAIALSVFILRYLYLRGVNVFSVFTVILSAFSFSMIFSQEVRLPFKDDYLIRVMIAQGALVLMVMGLWLLFKSGKKRHSTPVLPWLSPYYWLRKIKGTGFFASK